MDSSTGVKADRLSHQHDLEVRTLCLGVNEALLGSLG